MAASNQEQVANDTIDSQIHLHSQLNADIFKQIESLEMESLYEERFQVDQAKLEEMIMTMSCIEGKTNADLYFEQIMQSTQTQIEWLQSFKSKDFNNKKHPIIRVSGSRMEDVTWAKGLILASLEVSNSVFRLKMAISNVDHHFIMGRNNNNVNRIMDDTQTHIQFPDPNLVKKGNQVTIHGTLDDLEHARQMMRLSSPILMSFELPTTQPIPSSERIGNYFKVQVMFSSSSKPNTILVLIRGSTRRVDKLKKATRSLLSYALGKMAQFTIVSVQLEVPPQHQESVKGENSENIISIMEHTNTKIFFPDLTIRGNRRSQVTITGSIDEVLVARAELVGYFPIELTFDISSENESATEIMELGRRAGVCITISHKERDSGMSVTIKGSERSIDTIYEVHRSIKQINLTFPYDKYMENSIFLTDEDYQQRFIDTAMHNYVENLVERSETATSEGCFSEESPVKSSPGQFKQQNSWMIYEPVYKKSAHSEPSGLNNEYSRYYPPSQTYQHCYNLATSDVQETITSNEIFIPSYSDGGVFNAYSEQIQEQPQFVFPSKTLPQQTDWTICDLQGSKEIYDSSIDQTQSDFLQQNNLSIMLDVQNTELSFESHNNELDDDFQDEPQSPTSVNLSPLIVGSEESVAGRLICTGWGNLF